MSEMQTKFFVKVRKTGNSYAATIPLDAIKSLGWKEDDQILLEVSGKHVILSKVD